MKITRHFTTDTKPVEDQIEWKQVRASIPGAGFEMPDVEVPKHWSLTATNILAQKYLRKAGVPQGDHSSFMYVEEDNVPEWLSRCKPCDGVELGSETSAKQVFHRLAGHWTYVGWKHGYFKQSYITYSQNETEIQARENRAELNARAFYDELYFMLANQFAAPNSPQFFNTGLWWAYGITGPDSGQWAIDYRTTENLKRSEPDIFQPKDCYEYPQPHACFIQPVADDLVGPGGIMDLVVRESRLFKHGSGTGTNFSNIRAKGEKLGGGGTSSGLMSFLEVGDRAAGAIKSGGTTRRAAKMVCLNLDHPEIEDFINWKVREESKAAAMAFGSGFLSDKDNIQDWKSSIPGAIVDRAFYDIMMPEFSCDWEGEAIRTVSGQNSNNSVRVSDSFMNLLEDPHGAMWYLKERTTGKLVKSMQVGYLWNQICRAAWASADPGVQFDDTINAWNTCAADGKINASNPCGEYNFLDNTACNLASLNLTKFLQQDGTFNVPAFIHATRLWTIVLDISVSMASFPSREIALGSYNYRTLGLGYANVGGLLMRSGIPYDSDIGRDYAAAITALMHGVTYKTSAELAAELGPFPRWEHNKESMSKVIQMHKYKACHINCSGIVGNIVIEALQIWNEIDTASPFRNAQTTLIAPTGTIALLMDCDTTGIEPEFALKKIKLMAAGGTIQTINSCIWDALKSLNYKEHEINLISNYLILHGHLEGCPDLKPEHLAVFDCAMPPAGSTRCLSPIAHVKMVAAVQPFLSGGVSKTVNLPNNATIADVDQIYREAHRLGIKSIALYRDGSKLTQPLNVEKTDAGHDSDLPNMVQSAGNTDSDVNLVPNTVAANDLPDYIDSKLEKDGKFMLLNTRELEKIISKVDRYINEPEISALGARRRLPAKRRGYTQKVKIDGQSLHLRTGEYSDGTLGEIWLDFSRNGSTLGGILNAFAKSISIGLQYGVPLEEFVESFVHTKFEPAGIVQDHDRIKITSSLIDFIMRDLAIAYLNKNEYANIEEQIEQTTDLGPVKEYVTNVNTIADLLDSGYRPSGETCSTCGGQLIQSGTCKVCTSCGTSSGGCG